MNGQTNSLIAGQYGVKENSEPQLLAFFTPLKELGFTPQSMTVDGNSRVIKTLRGLWPDIIIQRCLVHVQRQGLMWCRLKPKRKDAFLLRGLFLRVTSIKTCAQMDSFLADWHKWERTYGSLIKEQPEWGKIFSDLKRARSMLFKALPNMFHYLKDPRIPATTNGLEGYFSRLKGHYQNHRGLNSQKRHAYFQWYFQLVKR